MTPTPTPERKCCEKCLVHIRDGFKQRIGKACQNSNCPCHTPESRLREDEVEKEMCLRFQNILQMPDIAWHDIKHLTPQIHALVLACHDVLRTTLSQEREALVGEILTAVRGMKVPDYNKDEAHNLGFEVAKQNAEWIVEDLLKPNN